MLSFLTILISGCYAASKTPSLSPSQISKILQLAGATDGLSCNATSGIPPALLLAASTGGMESMNMTDIMQQLSQVANLMYPAAYQSCQSLSLSSSQCFQDCIIYNHPITIFRDTSSPYFKSQLFSILEWYSVSGSPIGWYDVGNPDQCEFFHGQYCYTPLINKYDESQGIYPNTKVPHGCCAPGSCSGDDAVKVVKDNGWCFKSFNASYISVLGSEENEVKPFCEVPARDTTSFGFILVVFIFALFVFLVIMASGIYQYRVQFGGAKQMQDVQELNANLNPDDDAVKVVDIKKEVVERSGFLQIFSIQSIWSKYVSVRPPEKSALNFLDGIRVYSMSWVVLGHAYMYVFGASNAMTLAPFFPLVAAPDGYEYEVNKFSNIFIQYAFYSVDSFFWLSGFLATYSIYRNVSKIGNPMKIVKTWYKWIPMAYFARYLRLAPMMMFMVMVQWKISDQLPSGPATMTRGFNEHVCGEGWWRIMFMISNLWVSREGNVDALSCMGQLWYVQCDFQMYLLLPFLVMIFVWNKRAGIGASLVPFFVCLIIRFAEGFYYHFSANVILPDLTTVHNGDEMSQSYFKAWTRMSVYFIGVTTMFVMITINEHYQKKGAKFVLLPLSYYIIMGLALFTLASLVMWPYNDIKDAPNGRWGAAANEIYYALSKPAWGVGLSLLAFGLRYIDETERKMVSIIKAFLSAEIYQVLGKLTYVMYLTHLAVYAWWGGDNIIPSYYNNWFIAFLFIGIWSVTAVISFVLHIFMEAPINVMVTKFLAKLNKGRCGKRGRKGGNAQDAIQMDEVGKVEYNQMGNGQNFNILKSGSIQQDAI